MSDSARERVAVVLSGATDAEAFSAARTAPTGDLQLEVRGVGPIELPVSQAQAKQLCMLARPARHGRGEQTADPVQLYLDCRRAGERPLEAADAIRELMGW